MPTHSSLPWFNLSQPHSLRAIAPLHEVPLWTSPAIINAPPSRCLAHDHAASHEPSKPDDADPVRFRHISAGCPAAIWPTSRRRRFDVEIVEFYVRRNVVTVKEPIRAEPAALKLASRGRASSTASSTTRPTTGNGGPANFLFRLRRTD